MAEVMERRAELLAALPQEQFPVLVSLAGQWTVCTNPAHYVASGLDVLLL